MRLIKPSPGEAYDRMTILVLKMKHSTFEGFRQEHECLKTYLLEQHYHVPTELANELGRINSRLWDLEDAQRKLMKDIHFNSNDANDPKYTFLENAIIIVQLNDARAETVKKINIACGLESVEKIYDSNKNR